MYLYFFLPCTYMYILVHTRELYKALTDLSHLMCYLHELVRAQEKIDGGEILRVRRGASFQMKEALTLESSLVSEQFRAVIFR